MFSYGSRGGEILRALLVFAAALLVYSPTFSGDWVWDDNVEVVANPLLTRPDGLAMAWKGEGGADYLPVKASVQWIFTQATGKSPEAWRVLNFALHLFNAFLIWHIFARLRLREAWLGGLLFAIHPVAVMSVAWISEFKNTLSLAFLLPAMVFYMRFVDRSRLADYGLAFLFYVLAVLSKASVVMFPVVILLYLWWRNGRITIKDVAWSCPFFAVSLAAGLLTIYFQHARAMGGYSPELGLVSRLAIVGMAAVFYLFKSILPIGLVPTYSRWPVEHPGFLQFLPWLFLGLGGALLLWFNRKSWGRAGIFGLGFFFINLLPVLGFIPMAFSRFSFVSDHFNYLPLIGILGLVVAGVEKVRNSFPRYQVHFLTVGSALLVVMLITSRGYASVFKDEISLWSYTVRNNPDAWQAHLRLGAILISRGQFQDAIFHQNESVRLLKEHPEAEGLRDCLAVVFNNNAIIFESEKRSEEVIASLREAVRLDPKADFSTVLGRYYFRQGRLAEASECFAGEITRRPEDLALRLAYGDVLLRQKRWEDAAAQFAVVLKLEPENPAAKDGLERAAKQQSNETREQTSLPQPVTDQPPAGR